MWLRWLLAAVHLSALPIGAAAILMRGRSFASRLDSAEMRRLLLADAWWGIAALLWITTGLWRLFASTEKPAAYYLGSETFWVKMGLLGAILLLEIWPMSALMRWRTQLRRGEMVDTSRAGTFAGISRVQFVLVIAMVFVATAMARAIGW